MAHPITVARNLSKCPVAAPPDAPINCVCLSKDLGKQQVTDAAQVTYITLNFFILLLPQCGFHAQHRRRGGILQTATLFDHWQRCRESWRFAKESTQSLQQQCGQFQLQHGALDRATTTATTAAAWTTTAVARTDLDISAHIAGIQP